MIVKNVACGRRDCVDVSFELGKIVYGRERIVNARSGSPILVDIHHFQSSTSRSSRKHIVASRAALNPNHDASILSSEHSESGEKIVSFAQSSCPLVVCIFEHIIRARAARRTGGSCPEFFSFHAHEGRFVHLHAGKQRRPRGRSIILPFQQIATSATRILADGHDGYSFFYDSRAERETRPPDADGPGACDDARLEPSSAGPKNLVCIFRGCE